MVNFGEKKRWLSWTNVCIAIIAFAIGIVANWALRANRTPRPAPQATTPAPQPVAIDVSSADPGTVKRAVLEAKARGENTVEFFVISCGSDNRNLRNALSEDSVVVADLVEKKTYARTFNLYTVYRFKLRETLVEHPVPRFLRGALDDAPSDMLPIAGDEFLIEEGNGQIEIDGVTVIQHSNGARYREGQTYLLFLWFDKSTRQATRAGTEPFGVFLVDSEGNLTPYMKDPNFFKDQLEKRFKSSLNNMRAALKK